MYVWNKSAYESHNIELIILLINKRTITCLLVCTLAKKTLDSLLKISIIDGIHKLYVLFGLSIEDRYALVENRVSVCMQRLKTLFFNLLLMKFILGEKQSMTQFFAEDGSAHAATVVKIQPTIVTGIKTLERDGYSAVQVGYGTRNEKNIAKPQRGQFGTFGNFSGIKEFRVSPEQAATFTLGSTLDTSLFEADQEITVAGISKGKGFQGVVKRHGFAGGRRSHGQKHSEREPGSIGATGPQRVFKGTRMAGRMGADRITVKNLKVLAIDTAQNIILIKGAVPGRRGTLLEIISN